MDYEEKLYAAGRIPGSFMRREGRPSTASILIALAKNTSVASAFGVVELTKELSDRIRDHPSDAIIVFLGISAAYVVITLSVAGAAKLLETRLEVAR